MYTLFLPRRLLLLLLLPSALALSVDVAESAALGAFFGFLGQLRAVEGDVAHLIAREARAFGATAALLLLAALAVVLPTGLVAATPLLGLAGDVSLLQLLLRLLLLQALLEFLEVDNELIVALVLVGSQR